MQSLREGPGTQDKVGKVGLGQTHNLAHFLAQIAPCLGLSSPSWLLFSAQGSEETSPKS